MQTMAQLTRETGDASAQTRGRFPIRGVDLEADLPRLVRLFNETDAVDQADRAVTESELRQRLSDPGHDPTRDRFVVAAPGDPDRLIAHAAVFKPPTAPGGWMQITTHPDWRGQGLGNALLESALARLRDLGAAYVYAGAEDKNPAAQQFAERRGFRQVQTFIQMRALPETALAEPVLPAGYSVRTYAEVNDLPVLLEALNRGFIGHWEHHEETAEALAHWLTSESVRPEGIFLAFGPQGDVAGICFTEISAGRAKRRGAPTGYVDSLAVVPEHRRHGLGRALLLIGMRWLREQGQTIIELNAVGDNALALPLYENVGFFISQQAKGYRRDV
jgi:mycothiol synthase